jgi:hypothetical protein
VATVTITIPDALVPRVTAAMNGTFPEAAGYTPAVAFKEITSRYWRGILSDWEQRKAEEVAQAANRAAIKAAADKAAADGAGIT